MGQGAPAAPRGPVRRGVAPAFKSNPILESLASRGLRPWPAQRTAANSSRHPRHLQAGGLRAPCRLGPLAPFGARTWPSWALLDFV